MTHPNFLRDFEVKSLLGEGSFGVVWKCVKAYSNQYFAIKLCQYNTAAKREEKSFEKIRKHINIVDYHTSWKENLSEEELNYVKVLLDNPSIQKFTINAPLNSPVFFIQMELCEKNLRHKLAEPPEKYEDLLRVSNFCQILKGLDHIHQHQITHRDLKPENILISAGVLKISDFGLTAHPDDYTSSSVLLTPGAGTKLYLAPEQLTSTYNKLVDVYALGIIFLELLHPETQPAFHGGNFDALNHMVYDLTYKKEIPDLVKTKWSKETEVILQMVSHEPESRPDTTDLLKNLLITGIYIPGSRNMDEILSGAAKSYAFKGTLQLVLCDMKETLQSCTGNQVIECAEVIAQSLQKSDDKRVHELSLSILQQIAASHCTNEKNQLPSGLMFRLFQTLPNSLGLFSSVSILKRVCKCIRYILKLATDVEKVNYCYVPPVEAPAAAAAAVEKIILEASSFLSIAKSHDYLREVWKCLLSVTAISSAGCRAFVSSKGLEFFYECVENGRFSEDIGDWLVDITDVLSNIAQQGVVLNQDTSSKLISKLHSLLMFRSPFQVEFNIIRVFVHLIKRCGLSWDLRKSTKTCITNTVKSWDVKQNIPLPARCYKDLKPLLRSVNAEECRLFAAWAIANLSTVNSNEAYKMMEREGGISIFGSLLFTNENLMSPSVREYVMCILTNTFNFATRQWPDSDNTRELTTKELTTRKLQAAKEQESVKIGYPTTYPRRFRSPSANPHLFRLSNTPTASTEGLKTYQYSRLKTTIGQLPDDVDPHNLERHLSDAEFDRIFKMSKIEFYRQPEWKQTDMKRRASLL